MEGNEMMKFKVQKLAMEKMRESEENLFDPRRPYIAYVGEAREELKLRKMTDIELLSYLVY